jgi:hypothetical protein
MAHNFSSVTLSAQSYNDSFLRDQKIRSKRKPLGWACYFMPPISLNGLSINTPFIYSTDKTQMGVSVTSSIDTGSSIGHCKITAKSNYSSLPISNCTVALTGTQAGSVPPGVSV